MPATAAGDRCLIKHPSTMDLNMTASATVVCNGVYMQHPLFFGDNAQVLLPPTTTQSQIFATGSHYWSAGITWRNVLDNQPCMSMDLNLWTRGAKVKASVDLSLIDPRLSLPPSKLYTSLPPLDFAASDQTPRIAIWEVKDAFLSDRCHSYVDGQRRLVFQVTVTVLPEEEDRPETTTTTAIGKQIDGDHDVPPSDMVDQLSELLETREGADVTFYVDGELFQAHKIVLAMRSRVFKALLFGEMKESGAIAPHIEISGMTAETFRALLRYIYTDASPASSNQQQEEGCQGGDNNTTNKVWELLTAADLYSMERLKLICERVLCKWIDVDNVAEMLGLADQHHCSTLKDACIEFMITSHRMEQVQKTQGYLKLRELHPLLLVEVLEKSGKFLIHS